MKKIPFINAISFLFLLNILLGCRGETSPDTPGDVEVVTLDEYETIVSVEDAILAAPYIIKHHPETNTLFVYDGIKSQVLELNLEGEVVTEYGRAGRGPGEFQRANNLFLRDSSLYVVDYHQFLIHEFDLSGAYANSVDYGAMGGAPIMPGAPFSPSMIRAEDIDNQPVITQNENILLSTILTQKESPAIFQLMDRQGKILSNVGEIPPQSVFRFDSERYGTAIEDRRVPDFYKPRAFAIPDPSTTDEYFLVYSAIGKIAKYHADGRKLWETKITETPELKSYIKRFYEVSDQLIKSRNRVAFDKYVSGAIGNKRQLYLGLKKLREDDQSFIWIHRFNEEGELIRRYKLLSEDASLVPVFDVDGSGSRIFVVTESGDIRVYAL